MAPIAQRFSPDACVNPSPSPPAPCAKITKSRIYLQRIANRGNGVWKLFTITLVSRRIARVTREQGGAARRCRSSAQSNRAKEGSNARCLVAGGLVGLLEALGFLANQTHELLVAVVVQHAVELVAVVRDNA